MSSSLNSVLIPLNISGRKSVFNSSNVKNIPSTPTPRASPTLSKSFSTLTTLGKQKSPRKFPQTLNLNESTTMPTIDINDDIKPESEISAAEKQDVSDASDVYEIKSDVGMKVEKVDYSGLIVKPSLEQELVDLGYIPLDKIVVKCDVDTVCKYIKAVNKTGHIVYVEMDSDGFVVMDANLQKLKITHSGNVIPYSIKNGSYQCAKNEGCSGVLFECDNGICTIKSDSDINPTETNYITTEDSKGNKIIIADDFIPYPIVKFTDLHYNPELVSQNIKDASDKLRNTAFGNCNDDMNNLQASAKYLFDTISEFNQNKTQITQTLSSTISQLENFHEQYENDPPTNNAEKTKLQSIRYNLRRRHELVVELLKLCGTFTQHTQQLNKITHKLNELKSHTQEIFDGIDGILDN